MRSTILLCALAITPAFGQSPKPDAAHFAAEHANYVEWHPDGKFIGFSYREGERVDDIGIYDIARAKGKVLLKPGAGERVTDTQWLNGSSTQLVSTSSVEKVDGNAIERRTLWALDGNRMMAKAIWSQEFPADKHPRIFIEPSPSLPHAIVTVKTDAATVYYVVVLGAEGVQVSTDISQALAEGYGFAGWTVDGTGFFGKGIDNNLASELVTLQYLLADAVDRSTSSGEAGALGLAVVVADSVRISSSSAATESLSTEGTEVRTWVMNRASPEVPVGASGLELMPQNGVLRPVRFRGFWVNPPVSPTDTVLVRQPEPLRFKNSSASTQSVWLRPADKNAVSGVLVSADADQAWLSADGKTVAFTVNGVLFVRRMDAKL